MRRLEAVAERRGAGRRHRADRAAAGPQVAPERADVVRLRVAARHPGRRHLGGVAPPGRDPAHRSGRGPGRRDLHARRRDRGVPGGRPVHRPAQEGVQQPLARVQPEVFTYRVERHRPDRAQPHRLLGLGGHQQLADVTGLQRQIQLGLLGVERFDAARLRDQVQLEPRPVEHLPVVLEVRLDHARRALMHPLQHVLVGSVVVDARRQALHPVRPHMEVHLHGVGVARGRVEASRSAVDVARPQRSEQRAQRVEGDRPAGEVPSGRAVAVGPGGRRGAAEPGRRLIRRGRPQVPPAGLEPRPVLGREELDLGLPGAPKRGRLLPCEVCGDAARAGVRQQRRHLNPHTVPLSQRGGQPHHRERGRTLVPQVARRVHRGHAEVLREQSRDLLGQLVGRRPGCHPVTSRHTRRSPVVDDGPVLDGRVRAGGFAGVRRDPASRRRGPPHRPRQGVTVQLPVGGGRERRHEHDEVGDHVVGQRLGGERAQPRRLRPRRARLRLEVGDQLPISAVVGPGQHDRLPHRGVLAQTMLDLAELHPEAADLDLAVAASQERDDPVRSERGTVAGAVHAFARPVGERVGQEAAGGQLRVTVVAEAEAVARDVEVALLADRARLQGLVEDVVPRVVDGAAVRDAAPPRVDHLDREPVGPDRGLGRAAQADQARPRRHRPQVGRQAQRRVVTAEEDQPQVHPGAVAQRRQQRGQRRRRRVPEGDRLLGQHVGEQLRVPLLALVGHVQARAAAQKPEDVEHRQVEPERGHAHAHVAGSEAEGAVAPVEQVPHRPMRHGDALGSPGAAGGEDVVGGVVRAGHRFGVTRILVGARQQRVELDHRHVGPPVQRAHGGQHDARGGTGQHRRRPVGRQTRQHRQVRSARLEHAEHRRHHLRSPPGGDRDRRLGRDAPLAQAVRDDVGPPVQLAVGGDAVAPPQGDRAGPAAGLLLQQQVHRAIRRVGRRGVVPLVEHAAPLVGGEPADPLLLVRLVGEPGHGGTKPVERRVERVGGEVAGHHVPRDVEGLAVVDGHAVQRHVGGGGAPGTGRHTRRKRLPGHIQDAGEHHGQRERPIAAPAQHDDAQVSEPARAVGLGVLGEQRGQPAGPRGQGKVRLVHPDPAQRGLLAGAVHLAPGGPAHHRQGERRVEHVGKRVAERGRQRRVRGHVMPCRPGAQRGRVGREPQAFGAAGCPRRERPRRQVRQAGEPVLTMRRVGGGRARRGRHSPRGRVGVAAQQGPTERQDARRVGHEQVDRQVHGARTVGTAPDP